MTSSSRSRTLALIILVMLLVFQSVGALYGGFNLMLDPTGSRLGMPLTFLQGSPFNNYTIPGAILFVLLGLYPAIVIYGLVQMPQWRLMGALNVHREEHWACTHALYIGIMLIIWIDVQEALVGNLHLIQAIYAVLGLLITIFSLWPSVRKYYRVSMPEWQTSTRQSSTQSSARQTTSRMKSERVM